MRYFLSMWSCGSLSKVADTPPSLIPRDVGMNVWLSEGHSSPKRLLAVAPDRRARAAAAPEDTGAFLALLAVVPNVAHVVSGVHYSGIITAVVPPADR